MWRRHSSATAQNLVAEPLPGAWPIQDVTASTASASCMSAGWSPVATTRAPQTGQRNIPRVNHVQTPWLKGKAAAGRSAPSEHARACTTKHFCQSQLSRYIYIHMSPEPLQETRPTEGKLHLPELPAALLHTCSLRGWRGGMTYFLSTKAVLRHCC